MTILYPKALEAALVGHKWREYHGVVDRHLWGIESDDPDLIASGDEVVVDPSLPEQVAREIVEAHNARLSAVSTRSSILEEAARVADLCHADIVANPHDFGPTDSGGVVACKKIAAADAANWHMREATHYNGGDVFFAYLHRCVEQPRLSRYDRYERKDQSVKSTWRADGIDHPTIEAAIEALNTPPVFDAAELAFLSAAPQDWAKKGPPGTIDWEVNERVVNKGGVEWERGSYRITPAGRAAIEAQP